MNNDILLGKNTEYKNQYDPSILYPIDREMGRNDINMTDLPLYGTDIFNLYEISSLGEDEKPWVSCGKLYVPHTSPNLIESKSLKLYLNSFNNSKFSKYQFLETATKDISEKAGVRVILELVPHCGIQAHNNISNYFCIDHLKASKKEYSPAILKRGSVGGVTDFIFSQLMKSNCPVTNQPDWADIYIYYEGQMIQRESLLEYILSYRNKNEFHEQCVENIYQDIMSVCKPTLLTVYAKYTRRGGIDINPYRSNCKPDEYKEASRTWRQ